MKLNKMKCCFLVAFLLSGLASGLGAAAQPSRAPSGPRVSIQSTRTIDGDPSDWTGTPGGNNTFVISNGEGIWRDVHLDDTGNGSYVYPNVTHSEPAPIPPPFPPHFEYIGYPHGGMVDLMEWRATADSANLYMMFRFYNMGSTEIATEWEGSEFGFGKILAQVYIDKDRVPGSGRTNATMFGNFFIAPGAAWEIVINVAGNAPRGFPRIEFANGTEYYLNSSTYCQANCSIYPSCIEIKVPRSVIGDYRRQTWRFIVVVGGFDEGHWRQVWSTELAKLYGWPPLFRFVGGEGEDWLGGMGNDPNIIDMAFTSSQAEQEALLNEFQTTGQIVEIDAYQEIYFDASGDVSLPPVGGFIIPANKLELLVPWISVGSAVLITITTVVIRKRER